MTTEDLYLAMTDVIACGRHRSADDELHQHAARILRRLRDEWRAKGGEAPVLVGCEPWEEPALATAGGRAVGEEG